MRRLLVPVVALITVQFVSACSGGGGGMGASQTTASTPPTVVSTDPCVAATSKFGLWTNGACLRGFNVSLNYGVTPNQSDYNAIEAMGANFVRIAPSAIYSKTAPYALDTMAQTDLDNALTMIQKANMFAVIVFFDGPGRNFDTASPHSVWTTQAEQDAWVAMWKYAAARYKDNQIVVGYELMNEPNSNDIYFHSNLPSDFYPANSGSLYDWNPLALKITAAIRQADAMTPVLVGGMGWNAAAWMNNISPTGDNKTVYIFHQYEPGTFTHQAAPYANSYGTVTGTFTRADLVTQFAYVSSFKSSKNLPVGNTEFGAQRYEPGADQWLNDSMDIMESIGVNYVVHEWPPAALVTQAYYTDPAYNGFDYQFGTNPANYLNAVPNSLTTVIQKYLQKNTVRPSNKGY